MTTMEKSVTVDVPVHEVYDQWTQFESFPKFMEGVEEVRQLDDTHLHWKAQIAGVEREWDAEIVDQTPDERITWRATDGARNDGTVSFAPVEGGKCTRVTLRMDFEPEGFAEKAGDMLHIVQSRVGGDLDRFKDFIEHAGHATGGWRGEVKPGDADRGGLGSMGTTGTAGATGAVGSTSPGSPGNAGFEDMSGRGTDEGTIPPV